MLGLAFHLDIHKLMYKPYHLVLVNTLLHTGLVPWRLQFALTKDSSVHDIKDLVHTKEFSAHQDTDRNAAIILFKYYF